MDDFSLQIKTVCLVSVLTGVMGAFIPSGRLKKSFDSFCAAVLVAAILLPVNSLKNSAAKDINPDAYSHSDNGLLNQGGTAEGLIYKEVLEKALTGRVSQIAPGASVSVECEKNETGYEIKSFTVINCTAEEKAEVAAFFNEGFDGIPVYFKEE